MTKQSTEYEQFIASLIGNVKSSGRDIRKIRHGPKNVLKGASGQEHQVDISFYDYSYEIPTIVLIECKRWKKKTIDVSVPKVLKYNMDDILMNPEYPNHGIMIIATTSDFQSGTIKLSEHEGIIIKKVNHGPPFGFDYANLIQLAVVGNDIRLGEYVNMEISPPNVN